MSARRMQLLTLRKQALQRRSADLRDELEARTRATFQPAVALVAHLREARRWMKAHPALLAGAGAGAAALALRRKRRQDKQKKTSLTLLGWGGQAWWLWRTWRQIQPLLTKPK